MGRDWERGYGAGFAAGMDAQRAQLEEGDSSKVIDYMRGKSVDSALFPRKRKGKGKDPQPTLTKMTAPIWKKYKKGSGKKTYFDIRAQVRRSLAYKKAKKTKGP